MAVCIIQFFIVTIFIARRYASAVCYGPVPVRVCLSVCLCLSVTSRSSAKMARWIELIFGMEACSDLSCTTKITALPSGILSKTLDIENFVTVSQLY